MEPELKTTQRFYEIDLLRFLAALSVVLYHYTYRGYAANNYSPVPFLELGQVTKYGHLGVELFFIVSGYVVLLSAQGKNIRQFFISRVIRLYPAFWVSCSITFLVKRLWGTGSTDMHMPTFLKAGVIQYLCNMTMLHEFLGVEAIDGAYWSLTVEISFYFLISLLISYKLMRHINLFITLWLLYSTLPSSMQVGTPFGLLFFPSYAPYFAAGMLFHLIQQPQGRSWQRILLLVFSYLLAVRAVIGKANALAITYHEATSHTITVGIISAFFILFTLIVFRIINLSRFKWLMWLGAITYPLYLLHSDIGFIAFHWLGHYINKYYLLTGIMLLMVSLSYLVHILIEKRYSKSLGQQLNKLLANFDYK